MSLTPEELNELKKLSPQELLLLTYENSLETKRSVSNYGPRIQKLEDTDRLLGLIWLVFVSAASVIGYKLRGAK